MSFFCKLFFIFISFFGGRFKEGFKIFGNFIFNFVWVIIGLVSVGVIVIR